MNKIRILAMDGGGLYGLTEALWLEQLLKDNPDFLKPEDGVDYYFTGASAGGVNALLLAQEEDPRQAIRNGVLSKFWHEAGIYTNKNPVENFFSWFGIRPWLGTMDTMEVLKQYLGDKTMGDLPHRAIIATYNWYGHPDIEFPEETPSLKLSWPPKMPAMPTISMWEKHATYTDFGDHQWGPKFFTNFATSGPSCKHADDSHQKNTDVGFAVIAMPPVRSILGGVGDAGIFNANPSVDAIGAILVHYEREYADEFTNMDDYHDHVFNVLREMHMLSLGDGAIMPRYWLRDHSLGPTLWKKIPVNPTFGKFTPNDYMLNQGLQEAAINAHRLLYFNFWRLDPGVMKWPPGPVLLFVRNKFTREAFMQMVHKGCGAAHSLKAVQDAARFTKNGWVGDPQNENSHIWSKGADMTDTNATLAALEKRVATLEARVNVQNAAYHWIRTADQIETEEDAKEVERLAGYLFNDLMTEDGTCDFSAIEGWGGVWGPDKDAMVKQFVGFSAAIKWSYHIYPNAQVDIDIDAGEAKFWTTCEMVPLKVMNEKGEFEPRWFFLTEELSFRLVDGDWKVLCYKLSNLRSVKADGSDW